MYMDIAYLLWASYTQVCVILSGGAYDWAEPSGDKRESNTSFNGPRFSSLIRTPKNTKTV